MTTRFSRNHRAREFLSMSQAAIDLMAQDAKRVNQHDGHFVSDFDYCIRYAYDAFLDVHEMIRETGLPRPVLSRRIDRARSYMLDCFDSIKRNPKGITRNRARSLKRARTARRRVRLLLETANKPLSPKLYRTVTR